MSSASNTKTPLTNTNTEKPQTTSLTKEPAQAEPKPSSRGRKPTSKSSSAANSTAAPKKLPQRGLGVAQLERLRMQEKWKKMTEMPSLNAAQQLQLSPAPLDSVPVQYGAGGARLVLGGVGSGVVMDHGTNQYHHQMTNHSFGSNNINNHNYLQYPHHQEPKNNFQHLISNNGSYDFYDNLSFNFKKKRFNGEIGVLKNPNSDQTLQMGSRNNIISGGLNMYSNLNNINNNSDCSLGDHLTLGFGSSSKVPRTSSDPHNQGYEIMAVHRRVNGSINNGGFENEVVMEYEFFPGLINDSVVLPGSKEMLGLGGANQEASNNYYANNINNGTANSGSSGGNSVISYNYNLVGPENFNSDHLDLSLKL